MTTTNICNSQMSYRRETDDSVIRVTHLLVEIMKSQTKSFISSTSAHSYGTTCLKTTWNNSFPGRIMYMYKKWRSEKQKQLSCRACIKVYPLLYY